MAYSFLMLGGICVAFIVAGFAVGDLRFETRQSPRILWDEAPAEESRKVVDI